MRKLAGYLLFALALCGCADRKERDRSEDVGFLKLKASIDDRVRVKATIPVDGFDVVITSKSNGQAVYGKKVSEIGTAPLELDPGSYTINVSSPLVDLPNFGTPTYGIVQDFTVSSGTTTSLNLICKQQNAGVSITYSDAFKSYCQQNALDYSLRIDQGLNSLSFSNVETRAGYFVPGPITVVVQIGESEFSSTLNLAAQDFVNLTVDLTVNTTVKITATITGVDDVNLRNEKITINLKPNTNPQSEALVLLEDFSSITTGDNINSMGSNTLWSGNENFPSANLISCYKAGGAVRLGGSGGSGSMTTKAIDLSSSSGNVTVKVKVKGWSSVESDLKIKIGAVEKVVPYYAVMSGDFEEVTAQFTGVGTSSSTVTFISVSKRLFIDEVRIYR